MDIANECVYLFLQAAVAVAAQVSELGAGRDTHPLTLAASVSDMYIYVYIYVYVYIYIYIYIYIYLYIYK